MINPQTSDGTRLTDFLLDRGAFRDAPVSLVDVGASGGISGVWKTFRDQFQATGFEPFTAEVERLNRESDSEKVCYENYYVLDRSFEGAPPLPKNYGEATKHFGSLWSRASYNMSTSDKAHSSEYFDPEGSGSMASATISLDDFMGDRDVDFLKVDTDGYDYEVLTGSLEMFRKKPVLGLLVEVHFPGPVEPGANTFGNVDALLRKEGFNLYDLQMARYSRAALPRVYHYPFPAQTTAGQILWADALYFRDLGYPDYEKVWDISVPTAKVLKLACLFELFGLQDCAAELFVKYRETLEKDLDVAHCLDLLTPASPLGMVDYESYLNAFRSEPNRFIPSGPGA